MIVPVRKLLKYYVYFKKAVGKLEGAIVILQCSEPIFFSSMSLQYLVYYSSFHHSILSYIGLNTNNTQ